MEEHGVSTNNIITVYGNEETACIEDSDVSEHNMVVRVKHNIYEYNVFIAVNKLIEAGKVNEDDSFLLLHDTSRVGPQFNKKLDEILMNYHRRIKADITWASPNGQCNICVFTPKAAKMIADKWKDMLTLDKTRGIKIELNLSEESIKRFPLRQYFCTCYKAYVQGTECVYSEVPRVVLQFTAIDYYKYFFDCGHKFVNKHPEKP
jgi:hypothetical protein